MLQTPKQEPKRSIVTKNVEYSSTFAFGNSLCFNRISYFWVAQGNHYPIRFWNKEKRAIILTMYVESGLCAAKWDSGGNVRGDTAKGAGIFVPVDASKSQVAAVLETSRRIRDGFAAQLPVEGNVLPVTDVATQQRRVPFQRLFVQWRRVKVETVLSSGCRYHCNTGRKHPDNTQHPQRGFVRSRHWWRRWKVLMMSETDVCFWQVRKWVFYTVKQSSNQTCDCWSIKCSVSEIRLSFHPLWLAHKHRGEIRTSTAIKHYLFLRCEMHPWQGFQWTGAKDPSVSVVLRVRFSNLYKFTCQQEQSFFFRASRQICSQSLMLQTPLSLFQEQNPHTQIIPQWATVSLRNVFLS